MGVLCPAEVLAPWIHGPPDSLSFREWNELSGPKVALRSPSLSVPRSWGIASAIICLSMSFYPSIPSLSPEGQIRCLTLREDLLK